MHSTVRDEQVVGVVVERRARVRRDPVLDPPRAQRERVAHDDPARRHLPRGDQRVGARLVRARGGHVGGERAEPEMTRLPVQQRAEHARRVEARDAQPADPAVRRDERTRVAVRQERVVGDRRERRRRRGALRPLGRVGGGGHRRIVGTCRGASSPVPDDGGPCSGWCDAAMHASGTQRRRRRFDGCAAVTLAAGELEATFVPERGMVGVSLRHAGEELLDRQAGLSAYVEPRRGHGHPVPAPVGEPAGRLLLFAPRARRAAAARSAARPLRRARAPDPRPPRRHPLLGRGRARCATAAARALRAALDFAAHPELMAAFPFPHEVLLEAALTAEPPDDHHARPRRRAAHRCRSASASTRTCGCPAPIAPAGSVALPARRHLLLDDRGVPTGETEERPAARVRAGGPPLRRRLRPAPRRRRVLGVRTAGGRSRVTFERGYPVGQVFAPAGSPFICFEPMTAPTNALRSGAGLRRVTPGPRLHARCSRSRCASGFIRNG